MVVIREPSKNVKGSGRRVSLANDEYKGIGGRAYPLVPTCVIAIIRESTPFAETVIVPILAEESVFC
jgi:hypothetical protein